MKNEKITKELNRLRKAIKQMDNFLGNAPNGTVDIYDNHGSSAFRYRYYDGGKRFEKHLSKKDARLIKKLATKKYYKALLPVLRKELRLLEKQEEGYLPQRKYEAYERLGELKEYVTPLFVAPEEERKEKIEQFVEAWKKNEYTPYLAYSEGLKFKTNHGEYVRSKAEWMISNILNERKNILFRYEPEIRLPNGKVFRPDFEIINSTTGKIFFLEHVGKLGDPDYARQFVRKMNDYAKAGIIPGENLILTFESGDEVIDVEAVEAVIEKYFG